MKIVINTNYDGFSLSNAVKFHYLKRKGVIFSIYKSTVTPIINWRYEKIGQGVPLDSHSIVIGDLGSHPSRTEVESNLFNEKKIPRNDPDLIAVLEELENERLSGYSGEIHIIEIPDDVDWIIQDYDGYEWVAERHRTWGWEDPDQ